MKILLICLLCTFIIQFLSSCASSNPRPKINFVDENNNNGTVELEVGDQLEITLPGNPTTGYEWTIGAVDKAILLPQGEPEYKPESEALGAGGHYTLRLKAIAPGESWVRMVYRRSFDSPDVPSADEFKILVKVI